MVAEIIYAKLTAGNTYYAKPVPIVAAPWADDVQTMTENATVAGWFASSSVAIPANLYCLFLQAGASPADTDSLVGSVPMNLVTTVSAGANITTETTIVEAS